MKKYSEVKWSEVVRKVLTEYIRRLEVVEPGVICSEDLAEMKAYNLDVSSISLDEAIEFYAKARALNEEVVYDISALMDLLRSRKRDAEGFTTMCNVMMFSYSLKRIKFKFMQLY